MANPTIEAWKSGFPGWKRAYRRSSRLSASCKRRLPGSRTGWEGSSRHRRDLATKAELAELRTAMVGGFAGKPGKTYVWGILAARLMAYACGLAVLAILK
jgi:hypothetical protein